MGGESEKISERALFEGEEGEGGLEGGINAISKYEEFKATSKCVRGGEVQAMQRKVPEDLSKGSIFGPRGILGLLPAFSGKISGEGTLGKPLPSSSYLVRHIRDSNVNRLQYFILALTSVLNLRQCSSARSSCTSIACDTCPRPAALKEI